MLSQSSGRETRKTQFQKSINQLEKNTIGWFLQKAQAKLAAKAYE